MKRTLTLATLALAALPLAACSGGYSYGARVNYGYAPYAYNGWYDGYYGPIYDGYWGNDGYFWYRHGGGDRDYIRGDRDHFRRDGPGDRDHARFRPMQGRFTPDRGAHMPHFDRNHDRH